MNKLAAITVAAFAVLVAAPAGAGFKLSSAKNRVGVINVADGDFTRARVAADREPHWGKSAAAAETASGNTSYQNHHRWYSPDLGRDLSAEPLLQNPNFARAAAGQGLSTPAYAYANNAPTTFTDPTGECPWCVGLLIGMALTWESDQNANIAAPVMAFRPVTAAVMGNASGVTQLASGNYDQALGSFTLALAVGVFGPVPNRCEGAALYRAVGSGELADLQALGRYRVPAGGAEGKYFFQTPGQASNFARMMSDQPYTTTSVRVSPAELARGAVNQPGRGRARLLLFDNQRASRPSHDLELLGAAMTKRRVAARIDLIQTSEGGRSGPVLSGYRSLLRFEGSEVDIGFELELEPTSQAGIAPGASGDGRISLWAVEALPPLSVGQTFELREGTRVVGRGTIVEPNVP